MRIRHIGLIGSILLTFFLSTWNAEGQRSDQAELALKAAIKTEVVDGNLRAAIEQYKKIVELPDAGRLTVATALLRIGQCHEKLGDAEAKKAYERVVREFSDQEEMAATARKRLAALAGVASPPGSAARDVTVRRVWVGPWYGGMGAPSRDGAYLSFRMESENLGIRDLSTGQIRQLTQHESVRESAWSSVPSPDGKQVAYSWDRDGIWELRLVGIDGTEPRVLCSRAGATVWPTDWSPDGKSILAVLWNREGPGGQIALVSAEEASLRILKDFDECSPEGGPRFSPDGRFIAYDRPQDEDSGKSDIFILELAGGREIPLVEHPDNDVYPDWTPDGSGILFFSNRTGTMGAWWIQVAQGKSKGTPQLIKPDLRLDYGMGFTGEGSYYYGVHMEMNDVYIAEVDLATGRTVSPPRAATQRFVGTNRKPDWSPDGRQLLFLSKRGSGYWGTSVLCVRSTESGEVREVASELDRIPLARWSPDGRSLLLIADHPAQGFGQFRINVETGDIITGPKPDELFGYLPAFSRDGKTMFYQAAYTDPQKYSVMVRDLETNKDKELYSFTDPAHFASRLTLSPDGRQLAFVVAEDTEGGSRVIKVMPAAGGEALDVLRGTQIPFCEAPIAWVPDGASLIFLRQPKSHDSKTDLWLVSLMGGEPRKLDLSADGMKDISLHPDGRHIAFTEAENKDEVWVLENITPILRPPKK